MNGKQSQRQVNVDNEPNLAALFSPQAAVQQAITRQLADLRRDSGARCVLLINLSGFPIAAAGAAEDLDVTAVSALASANFQAAAELAQLLGNRDGFRASHFYGPNLDIYASLVNDDHLLAIVFGSRSKMGVVRFCLRGAAARLCPLLSKLTAGQPDPPSRMGGVNLDDVFRGVFGSKQSGATN